MKINKLTAAEGCVKLKFSKECQVILEGGKFFFEKNNKQSVKTLS